MKGLCVYVDGGKGHYVPAKTVKEELEKLGIETMLEEFFDYLDIRWMGHINKTFWRTMLRFPALERHISKHNDTNSNGMEWGIRFANKHCWRMFKANLNEFRPDFIFATHPYASTILAEMLSNLNIDIPVYYYATDVFSAPVASICNKLRKFYISTEEGASVVKAMGQPVDTVEIVPFPLQQAVINVRNLDKNEMRRKLGLNEELFTLQLNLGGEGLGSLNLLEALIKKNIPMQIVIVGGIDKKMSRKINFVVKRANNTNVKVFNRGFISNVDEYLAASDIVAGRAGINTIVEAIYAHRPFLITELVYTVIPSANYIEKYNVGWNCSRDNKRAVELVLEYIQHPSKLKWFDKIFSLVPISFGAGLLANKIIDDISTFSV